MRAAVLGLGSIGMRHARNLKALGVDDVVGMDPDPSRRSRFESETSSRAMSDMESVLATRPEFAVIASPNRYHVEQAITCARAGCHLLIEKPLGSSNDNVDALITEVEKRGLFAHVGSNWKFHPAFTTMKRLLDDGAAGRVTGAQVLAGQWLPDWHPWEDYRGGYSARADLGGGVVFDTHEIDYLAWLLGPIKAVTGMTARSGALEIECEDVAVACFRFESGALASLMVDYIQRDYRRSYHISGDAGTIEWDVRLGAVLHYRAAEKRTRRYEAQLDDPNAMYVAQTQHVLDGIAGRCIPVTPIAVAAQVLRLQLALKAGHA